MVPILAIAALLVQQFSLDTIRDIRKLERIPLTPIGVDLPGPVRCRGVVKQLPDTELLQSHWTATSCVWYRAVKEVETTDSEGNTSWDTVFNESKGIDFLLTEDNAAIEIDYSPDANFSIPKTWRKTQGKERFTEYRIELSDRLYIVGMITMGTDGASVIQFTEPGEYIPIISKSPIAEARASRAVITTISIIISLFFASAACVCFALAFRLHNALGFVTAIGIIEVLFLLAGGFLMMSHDLKSAHQSFNTQQEAGLKIVISGFHALDIPFNGTWTDTAAFEKAKTAKDPGQRLVAIRSDLAARAQRTASVRDRFPQSAVAWVMGIPPTPKILADGEQATASTATIKPAIPNILFPIGIVVVGAVTALFGLIVGFKKIKLKRLIENIPTTPTNDVEIGITEICGTVHSCEDIEPLTGPLTDHPCVWFRYLIQEWRGSGKNRRLHTIEDRKRGQVFLCTDNSGSIPVASHGARIISGRKAKKSRGNRVYTEYSLRPTDPVYVLGSAEIDPTTGDSLRIEQDPQGLPFLISNLPERRIKTREIVGAFWHFACGIAATAAIILGLLLFTGRIAAIDQLLAACASIAVVALVVIIIMYNDLIFLRQRVAWARSNIEVALKKRVDLLPQLEAIAKGYMKYEQEVLPLLTRLRNAWSMRGKTDTPEESVAVSNNATDGLLALREQYPNLKADTTTEQLMRGIVALENEIAARRDGYNAAVERYHARMHAIPEVFLAKTFAFKEEPLLRWDTEIRDLDRLDFGPEERTEEDLGIKDPDEPTPSSDSSPA